MLSSLHHACRLQVAFCFFFERMPGIFSSSYVGPLFRVSSAQATIHQQPSHPGVPNHPHTIWKKSGRAGHAHEAKLALFLLC